MKTIVSPFAVAGAPSACSGQPGQIDIVAAGGPNTVLHWSGTGALPVTLQRPPGAGVPAESICAVSPERGVVDVFAAESGTRSLAWWRRTGGAFGPVTVLPSGAGGGPFGSPGVSLPPVAAAAVGRSRNDVDVFAAGAGNAIWWWHWNGTLWTQPGQLPAIPGGLPAVGLAAASPSPGRLDVFGIGADRHLHHWWSTGGAWGLDDLGGNLPAQGVSAVSWGPGRLDVFAGSRDPGNPISHWWWAGGGWGQDQLAGPVVQGAVAAVSVAPGFLDVFGVSPSQSLVHWHWNGLRWVGPLTAGEGIPAGDLTAVALPYHRVAVFARGAGGQLVMWPGAEDLSRASRQTWTNWPKNRSVNPQGHLAPDSLAELADIVAQARRAGQPVRAVGSSWSNSDVAVTNGYVVETNRLNRELSDVVPACLNATGSGLKLIHAEAGMVLEDLNLLLDRRNLAVLTMGGSSGQTLAGVLSTSARGMDVDRGPIPEMVRAIHLVGPDGVQHWIERSGGITDGAKLTDVLGPDVVVHRDDDWFASAVVSMGSLGIIYSLVIEVTDQHDLEDTRVMLDWGVVKTALRGGAGNPFVAGNRGVQVAIDPYPAAAGGRAAYLTTRRQLPPTSAAPSGGIANPVISVVTDAVVKVAKLDHQQVPKLVSALTAAVQAPGTARGWAHTVMGTPNPGPTQGLTVGFMLDATNPTYLDCVDAILELIDDANRAANPLGFLGWVSLRFQGAATSYLSPGHGRARTCFVELAAAWRGWPLDTGAMRWPDTELLLPQLEAEARRWGGAFHWGLNFDVDRNDTMRSYARLDTWRRVRWALTKGGTARTFDSDFTRRCGLSDPPLLASAGHFAGGGAADFAIWRHATGEWWRFDRATGIGQPPVQWGLPGDIPVPGDYDGDGKTDMAVWRPTDGKWYVIDSSTGTPRPAVQWGQAGDIPVPGDYDGDGKTDMAVWRPTDGKWYVIDSSTGTPRPAVQWGQAGDIPVPGDYDGDGKTDMAVWRPSDGKWYSIDSATRSPRPAVQWGDPDDIPVPGDYDGDGRTDVAIWRPSTRTWWVIDSSTGAQHAIQLPATTRFDAAIPRDRAIAVGGRRGGAVAVLRRPAAVTPDFGAVPVPGKFLDGVKTDCALWSPSTGTWQVVDRAADVTVTQQWGQPGDVPV